MPMDFMSVDLLSVNWQAVTAQLATALEGNKYGRVGLEASAAVSKWFADRFAPRNADGTSSLTDQQRHNVIAAAVFSATMSVMLFSSCCRRQPAPPPAYLVEESSSPSRSLSPRAASSSVRSITTTSSQDKKLPSQESLDTIAIAAAAAAELKKLQEEAFQRAEEEKAAKLEAEKKALAAARKAEEEKAVAEAMQKALDAEKRRREEDTLRHEAEMAKKEQELLKQQMETVKKEAAAALKLQQLESAKKLADEETKRVAAEAAKEHARLLLQSKCRAELVSLEHFEATRREDVAKEEHRAIGSMERSCREEHQLLRTNEAAALERQRKQAADAEAKAKKDAEDRAKEEALLQAAEKSRRESEAAQAQLEELKRQAEVQRRRAEDEAHARKLDLDRVKLENIERDARETVIQVEMTERTSVDQRFHHQERELLQAHYEAERVRFREEDRVRSVEEQQQFLDRQQIEKDKFLNDTECFRFGGMCVSRAHAADSHFILSSYRESFPLYALTFTSTRVPGARVVLQAEVLVGASAMVFTASDSSRFPSAVGSGIGVGGGGSKSQQQQQLAVEGGGIHGVGRFGVPLGVGGVDEAHTGSFGSGPTSGSRAGSGNRPADYQGGGNGGVPAAGGQSFSRTSSTNTISTTISGVSGTSLSTTNGGSAGGSKYGSGGQDPTGGTGLVDATRLPSKDASGVSAPLHRPRGHSGAGDHAAAFPSGSQDSIRVPTPSQSYEQRLLQSIATSIGHAEGNGTSILASEVAGSVLLKFSTPFGSGPNASIASIGQQQHGVYGSSNAVGTAGTAADGLQRGAGNGSSQPLGRAAGVHDADARGTRVGRDDVAAGSTSVPLRSNGTPVVVIGGAAYAAARGDHQQQHQQQPQKSPSPSQPQQSQFESNQHASGSGVGVSGGRGSFGPRSVPAPPPTYSGSTNTGPRSPSANDSGKPRPATTTTAKIVGSAPESKEPSPDPVHCSSTSPVGAGGANFFDRFTQVVIYGKDSEDPMAALVATIFSCVKPSGTPFPRLPSATSMPGEVEVSTAGIGYGVMMIAPAVDLDGMDDLENDFGTFVRGIDALTLSSVGTVAAQSPALARRPTVAHTFQQGAHLCSVEVPAVYQQLAVPAFRGLSTLLHLVAVVRTDGDDFWGGLPINGAAGAGGAATPSGSPAQDPLLVPGTFRKAVIIQQQQGTNSPQKAPPQNFHHYRATSSSSAIPMAAGASAIGTGEPTMGYSTISVVASPPKPQALIKDDAVAAAKGGAYFIVSGPHSVWISKMLASACQIVTDNLDPLDANSVAPPLRSTTYQGRWCKFTLHPTLRTTVTEHPHMLALQQESDGLSSAPAHDGRGMMLAPSLPKLTIRLEKPPGSVPSAQPSGVEIQVGLMRISSYAAMVSSLLGGGSTQLSEIIEATSNFPRSADGFRLAVTVQEHSNTAQGSDRFIATVKGHSTALGAGAVVRYVFRGWTQPVSDVQRKAGEYDQNEVLLVIRAVMTPGEMEKGVDTWLLPWARAMEPAA